MPSEQGLREAEVRQLQQRFGRNVVRSEADGRMARVVKDIVLEPMFLMLLAACLLYFLLRQPAEGFMMLAAMLLVAAISLYQETRSAKALRALRQLTAPLVTVIRDGAEKEVAGEELVPGDILLLSEGEQVPADATILEASDFSVDESVLTGESLPVIKGAEGYLYQGTSISSGSCMARVAATGGQTELGKLGKAVSGYTPSATLLQKQIGKLVQKLAGFGVVAFLLIFILNLLQGHHWVSSLLFGLTLAMAALPEEIPVAFSSFMALGAYRMASRGIITRQPQTVESLGAITVLCLDKTGTITENKMQVQWLYDAAAGRSFLLDQEPYTGSLLWHAVLASEARPFDAMEQALEQAWRQQGGGGAQVPAMVYEYPLEGKPPMMTHVYPQGKGYRVAAKGAAERILRVCRLPQAQARGLLAMVSEQAAKGYRVLGVASATTSSNQWPQSQDDFNWHLEGLVGLYDPPKAGIREALKELQEAGIQVKLLTGDFPLTARNIARQVGLTAVESSCTGEEVMQMPADVLREKLRSVHLFARMFPDAKLKVIEALKANGETVAMSGDGVNDGPAIRSAQVGIAMGKRGTEIARQAADLILTNDDLGQVVEGVRQGRRIYTNLKKAVRYIISIHIPIILTASLPLVLGWRYPNIFTPIHVIFLELIMGPTCSIFFEREPAEANSMQQPPRKKSATLLSRGDAIVSVIQGLAITAGVLSLYYWYMQEGATLDFTRTIVFVTLICSNILLTFINRSFVAPLRVTLRYPNNLAPWVLGASLLFLLLVLLVPALRGLFGLVWPGGQPLLICVAIAALSLLWFEGYKWVRYGRNDLGQHRS